LIRSNAFAAKKPVDKSAKSFYDVMKGVEEEEYDHYPIRESGSPAERPLGKGWTEGSFGAGFLKRLCVGDPGSLPLKMKRTGKAR
jgi:hypothetical protein